jgi:hypothetical protein
MGNEAPISNENDEIPILCSEEPVKTSTSLKMGACEARRFVEKSNYRYSTRVRSLSNGRGTI